MMLGKWVSFSVLSVAFLAGSAFASARTVKNAPKEVPSFGVLQMSSAEEAQRQAETWLKSVGKTDEGTQKAFQAIWNSSKPTLDKVAQTLILGDGAAAKLLKEARDPFSARCLRPFGRVL